MAGVTFREQSDGSTPAVSAGVKIGRDSVIGYGVQIYGKTTIGRCCPAPEHLRPNHMSRTASCSPSSEACCFRLKGSTVAYL